MQASIASRDTDAPPGPALGAVIGLIALFFLPLVDGGYSGPGYQIGLVLLPVAAAIAWATSRLRPLAAVVVTALLGASAVLLPLWIHPGQLLWHYAFHIVTAWVVVWVLLNTTPAHARWLLPVLVASSVLASVSGWWQLYSYGGTDRHIVGTFGLHNAFAGYLLIAWPVALYATLQCRRWYSRLLYALAALLLVVTIVFTYSRASWIVLLLQLAGLGIWVLRRRFKAWGVTERTFAWGVGLLIAGAATLACLPAVRHVITTIVNPQDYSMLGRLRFWQAALAIFADHPWGGVGLGNFAFTYPQYQLDWRYYSVDPHSWPLQLLAELGLPGLAVAVLVIAGTGRWLWRLWRATGGSAAAAALSCAVLGSLIHAAVDFDYTFGATTAILGAVLALGAYLSQDKPALLTPSAGTGQRWLRLGVVVAVAGMLGAAVAGQGLTLERYTLDRIREAQDLAIGQKLQVLRQAVRFVPYNFRTHYQLASLLSLPGRDKNLPEATRQLAACIRLNPQYTLAYALRGRLAGPGQGDADLEHALKLDPYNYPEHYFLWASLAQTDADRRQRLLLGLERIPIHHPIRRDHIRPAWYQLNPMMVEWYAELEHLAQSDEERQLYRSRVELFQQFLKNEAAQSGTGAPAAGEAPVSSI